MTDLTIVVIDDEFAILEEILDFLELQNITAYGADNGPDGLELIRHHQPDLVICDVMMPEMDGFELLKILRSHSDTSTIPFVFLTAMAEVSDRRYGMELGADDYITKPFKYHDLMQTIYARLKRQKQQEITLFKAFSKRLITLQENEKLAIATQVRTELMPSLAGAKLALKRGQLFTQKTILTILQDVIDELDQLAESLSPGLIPHVTLAHIMHWSIQKFQSSSVHTVEFRHADIDQSFSNELKLAVFRLLNEVLAPFVDHPTPVALEIDAQYRPSSVQIQIMSLPNGHEILNQLSGNIDGLKIREYVRAFGGEFDLSHFDQEMIVHLTLPAIVGEIEEEGVPTLDDSSDLEQVFQFKEQAASKIGVFTTNRVYRTGLTATIEADPSFEVQSGSVAVLFDRRQDIQSQFDVILVDLQSVRDADQLSALPAICQTLKTIFMASAEPVSTAYELLEAGAFGLLSQSAEPEEIINAVHAAIEGNQSYNLFSEQEIRAYKKAIESQSRSIEITLTPRETEILELILKGKKTKNLATLLKISPRTVESHRFNLMKKFRVNTQVDLVRSAIEYGF